jgi:hypothetical protein
VSLSHEFEPWQWRNYQPSWVEMAILAGSFAWFAMWFLLFLRLLPAVSVQELKEVLPPPMRKRVVSHATPLVKDNIGPGTDAGEERGR